MLNSVLTSLRANQLEKKLKKKYGLSEAEAKEILRQGRVETAAKNKSRKGTKDSMENLKDFCEEQLRHRSTVDSSTLHLKGDAVKHSPRPDSADYPANGEPCCSGTVAWSKSDTETNSAWGNSPAKSTDNSMTPPEQIYPLQKYMHQEDSCGTDNRLTNTNEEDRSLPYNSDTNEHLPPAPEILLTMIKSGEVLSKTATEITERSPVERKLNYEEKDAETVQQEESSEHPDKAVKRTSSSNKISSTTLMAFLEHPSRMNIPSGPPSLASTKSRDPVKRSLQSRTPESCDTPSLAFPISYSQINPTGQLVDSTQRKDEAQLQDEEVSVMTREEEPEGAVERMANEKLSSAKVNPKAKRRVQPCNVPRVIFVQDPPEIEVLPFTDEEGFVIKREKRLAPIERVSL